MQGEQSAESAGVAGGSLPTPGGLLRRSLLAVGAFVAGLGLYIPTMAPGLLWGGGDFARFQTWAYLGYPEMDLGVFTHSLWVTMAHPFTWLPVNDPAWRASLAAAVFASLALAFVALAALELTHSVTAALGATTALAVSHTFWTYAVMPKVYSLNALFLSACLYLLISWRSNGKDWRLILAGLLYGLSFLNHLVMATAGLGLLAFLLAASRQRPDRPVLRSAGLSALGFLLGLVPYLLNLSQSGGGATVEVVVRFMRGLAYPLTDPAALATGLGWGVALGLYQFPLTVLAGLAGGWALWKRDRPAGWLVLLGMLGPFLFLLAAVDPRTGGAYVWNLHYYLMGYVVFALAIAAGVQRLEAGWIEGWHHRWLILAGGIALVPIAAYAIAPMVARQVMGQVPDFRPLPGRDNFVYVLSPWKHNETGARPYAERILAALPADSALLADYSIWSLLHYLQVVEGQRLDVDLVLLPPRGAQLELLQAYRHQPDLYLADTYRYYDLDHIEALFEIEPHGPVLRLKPRGLTLRLSSWCKLWGSVPQFTPTHQSLSGLVGSRLKGATLAQAAGARAALAMVSP